MTATLTTVDAILKEVYGPRIVDQLQSEVIGLKRIERSSDGVTETVGGKYVDFPIRVTRNHGVGYRNENEQLPAAKRNGYAEVHVELAYGYGRVRLTGQTMRLAEKNHQAFASAMDREMDGLKETLSKDSARIFYGDGTGLLASITSTTVTNATQSVDSVKYLEDDMQVDVLTRSTGASTVSDSAITDINGLDVTIEDAYTGAATLGLYRQGSYDREPEGLGSIVDDTATLFGVNPSTQRKWAAIVDDNSGTNRALSESLMISNCDSIRVNGGKASLILCSLGVRRSYFNLLTQQRRYTNTKEFEGGFTGLAFNYGKEIPVVEDVDHPDNKMHILSEKDYKVYQEEDWHWADDDGNVLKWVDDYDAWEGLMRKYWQIGVERRNTQAVIKDITEA